MSVNRTVHIYISAGYGLLPTWRETLPEFIPRVSWSAEKNEKGRREHDANAEQQAKARLDCCFPNEIHAIVYDFESEVYESTLACPSAEDTPHYIVAKDVKSAGASFLKGLHDTLSSRSRMQIEQRRVLWRSKESQFIHRACRIDAARQFKSILGKVNPNLFFAPATFGWTSLMGPERDAAPERLIKQFGIFSEEANPIRAELDITLQLFERFGMCRATPLPPEPASPQESK